ncbi:MAG: hypothetical protein R3200_14545 [Xanthomonadales bacterium]|nr:hypothetical protein [Xanthomonadales bacterium]
MPENELSTRLLTAEEFEATVEEPMRDMTRIPGAAVELDIWPYADAVLEQEYADQDTAKWDVKRVYCNAPNTFQHVLIPTHERNGYLVIVIDVGNERVLGHYRLNPDRRPGGSVLEA